MLSAYAVPAAVTWAVLGAALGALALARPALVLAGAYAAVYGTAQVSGWLGLPAPGTRWQVPADMVLGASPRRRILVWGAILGPGLATRNPYAGFGLLLIAVTAAGGPAAGALTGLAVGLAHAAGRALALLRDAPRPAADPIQLIITTARWRVLDGYALLVIAGAVAARLLT